MPKTGLGAALHWWSFHWNFAQKASNEALHRSFALKLCTGGFRRRFARIFYADYGKEMPNRGQLFTPKLCTIALNVCIDNLHWYFGWIISRGIDPNNWTIYWIKFARAKSWLREPVRLTRWKTKLVRFCRPLKMQLQRVLRNTFFTIREIHLSQSKKYIFHNQRNTFFTIEKYTFHNQGNIYNNSQLDKYIFLQSEKYIFHNQRNKCFTFREMHKTNQRNTGEKRKGCQINKMEDQAGSDSRFRCPNEL